MTTIYEYQENVNRGVTVTPFLKSMKNEYQQEL